MSVAGRVAIKPSGDYNVLTPYKRLDLVSYDGGLYLAKKASTGIAPTTGSDTEYWMYCGVSNITVDSTLSDSSINPVQNKVIKAKFDDIEQSFQDGVDTLYDKAVSEGSTPTSSTPTAIAAAMKNIRSGGDADASDLISGKTAYSGGSLLTGTFSGVDATLYPKRTSDITETPPNGKYFKSVTVKKMDHLNINPASEVVKYGAGGTQTGINSKYGLGSVWRNLTVPNSGGACSVVYKSPIDGVFIDDSNLFVADFIDMALHITYLYGISEIRFGLTTNYSTSPVTVTADDPKVLYGSIPGSDINSGSSAKISFPINDVCGANGWQKTSSYEYQKTYNGIVYTCNDNAYGLQDFDNVYFFIYIAGSGITLQLIDLHVY